jgi:predicted nucleotidyltransferase component of viral defense system
MQSLVKQEQFELELLDRLNSGKFLSSLIFTGGTMLRLCFGLDRFSVDLDFWLAKSVDAKKLYKDLSKYLEKFYELTDRADKFYTLLFELRSPDYPRKLKIEIRKENKKVKTESAIAYSEYANRQVILSVVTLQDIMKAKIEAFGDRKEIRDVFDIEFLLKKGIGLDISPKQAEKILKGIGAFTKRDYDVKLAAVLDKEKRKYYTEKNFKILKTAIKEIVTEG